MYDLLFRWFVGLGIDDPVWNHFCVNIDELFFEAIKHQAASRQLLSREHFTVDGTLLEACAGIKSFKPKGNGDDDSGDDDNQGVNFHGE